MRKVTYASTVLYTGDDICRSLFDYASALAQVKSAATIRIPGRTIYGELGEFELLLGTATQLASEPSDREWAEVIDDEVVERLIEATFIVAPPLEALDLGEGS